MKYRLFIPQGKVQAEIILPASKSISNRLLIINALSGAAKLPENLSDSDDTQLMVEALESDSGIRNIGHAGTTMRFLTAYYSSMEGAELTITGSGRMKERPIGPLVNALRELGAEIEYQERDGYPPVQISGKKLKGGALEIDGSTSSQFITALLLIAPTLKNGLQLVLKGDVVSSSYINMTLQLMEQYGISFSWNKNIINVEPGEYLPVNDPIESDWSAASYWFALAFASKEAQVGLSYLYENSLQGDSALVHIFSELGLASEYKGEAVYLKAGANSDPGLFVYDFTNCPDIVQSMAVVLCLKGISFRFTGTRTLKIKETDRIYALQVEMRKLGFVLESDEEGSFLAWTGETCDAEEDPVIETYHDHRMAMSFAVVALQNKKIVIDDPMVVTKSYPSFWEDLKYAGFGIEVIS